MRRFKLYDLLSPEGEHYEVSDEGEVWCTNSQWESPIPAFVLVAAFKGVTQYEALAEYASKYADRLEEV